MSWTVCRCPKGRRHHDDAEDFRNRRRDGCRESSRPLVFPGSIRISARLNPFGFARHLGGVYPLLAMLTCVNAGLLLMPCGKLSGENSPVFPCQGQIDALTHFGYTYATGPTPPAHDFVPAIGLQTAYRQMLSGWF